MVLRLGSPRDEYTGFSGDPRYHPPCTTSPTPASRFVDRCRFY
ncbi:hypothetical protein HMPREF9607_01618 [Cutibacterium modestum HL044PA1]|uniref:Uncharacterized protein n=1 Tax=Cutibacterium modestum HL044PA1 TaxID=765109 RepID=A0ABP2K9F7_9ACTN|nr:hypothetical protein HMPREF9607_01618 [Cutibacterium modestum HL044PA1]